MDATIELGKWDSRTDVTFLFSEKYQDIAERLGTTVEDLNRYVVLHEAHNRSFIRMAPFRQIVEWNSCRNSILLGLRKFSPKFSQTQHERECKRMFLIYSIAVKRLIMDVAPLVEASTHFDFESGYGRYVRIVDSTSRQEHPVESRDDPTARYRDDSQKAKTIAASLKETFGPSPIEGTDEYKMLNWIREKTKNDWLFSHVITIALDYVGELNPWSLIAAMPDDYSVHERLLRLWDCMRVLIEEYPQPSFLKLVSQLTTEANDIRDNRSVIDADRAADLMKKRIDFIRRLEEMSGVQQDHSAMQKFNYWTPPTKMIFKKIDSKPNHGRTFVEIMLPLGLFFGATTEAASWLYLDSGTPGRCKIRHDITDAERTYLARNFASTVLMSAFVAMNRHVDHCPFSQPELALCTCEKGGSCEFEDQISQANRLIDKFGSIELGEIEQIWDNLSIQKILH